MSSATDKESIKKTALLPAIRVSPDMRRRLEAEARARGVPIASLIREAVVQWMRNGCL